MTDISTTPPGAPIDDVRARNKNLIFAALAEAGIQTLTLGFDGCGDSGQIDDIEAWSTGNDSVAFPSNRKLQLVSTAPDYPPTEFTLQQAIETLVYDYLDETCYGWEDNEGGFGTFVFDIPARTITLKHNVRFTDFVTHNHSF